MTRRPIPAPNYTNAFLATFGLLLFIVLCALAMIGGLVLVAIGAVAMDLAIKRVERSRSTPSPAAPSRDRPPRL